MNLCEENKKKTLQGSNTALFGGLPKGVNHENIDVEANLRELQKWFIAKLVELHNNCLIEFIVNENEVLNDLEQQYSDAEKKKDMALFSHLKFVGIRQILDHKGRRVTQMSMHAMGQMLNDSA